VQLQQKSLSLPAAILTLPSGATLSGNLAGKDSKNGGFILRTPKGDISIKLDAGFNAGSTIELMILEGGSNFKAKIVSVDGRPYNPNNSAPKSDAQTAGFSDESFLILPHVESSEVPDVGYSDTARRMIIAQNAEIVVEQQPLVQVNLRALVASINTDKLQKLMESLPEDAANFLAKIIQDSEVDIVITNKSPPTPVATASVPAPAPDNGSPIMQAAIAAYANDKANDKAAAPVQKQLAAPQIDSSEVAHDVHEEGSYNQSNKTISVPAQFSSTEPSKAVLTTSVATFTGNITAEQSRIINDNKNLFAEISIDQTISPATSETSETEPASGEKFSALNEIVKNMRGESSPQINNFLNNILPTNNSKMLAGLMLFYNALGAGNIRKIVTEELEEEISSSGKSALKKALGEMASFSASSKDGDGTVWQSYSFPVFDGSRVNELRLHINPDNHNNQNPQAQDNQSASDDGDRFIFELSLSSYGKMEMDGQMRPNRTLELVIRCENPISGAMKTDIYGIFHNAMEVTGYKGGLIFQTTKHLVSSEISED